MLRKKKMLTKKNENDDLWMLRKWCVLCERNTPIFVLSRLTIIFFIENDGQTITRMKTGYDLPARWFSDLPEG